MTQLEKIKDLLLILTPLFQEAEIEFSSYNLPAHNPRYPHVVIRPETIKPSELDLNGGVQNSIVLVFHICSIRNDFEESEQICKQIEEILNFKDFESSTIGFNFFYPSLTYVYDEEALQKIMLEYVVLVESTLTQQVTFE